MMSVRYLAVALAVSAGLSLISCSTSEDDSAKLADSAGALDVDSNRSGVDVAATETEFEFDGTVESIAGDNVTIKHEAIGDYKPAGSNSFKLAHPDMAQYVAAGEDKHFTLKVVGEESLITTIEDADDEGGGDSTAVRPDDAKK